LIWQKPECVQKKKKKNIKLLLLLALSSSLECPVLSIRFDTL
jgi:hypothetical protein